MIYIEYNTKTKMITRVVSSKAAPQAKAGCTVKATDDSIPVQIGEHIDALGLTLKEKIERGFVALGETEIYDDTLGFIRPLTDSELKEKFPVRFPSVTPEIFDTERKREAKETALREEIRSMQDLENILYSPEQIREKQMQLLEILKQREEKDGENNRKP